MYRLVGPNLIVFVPLIIIGIVIVTITPNYFGVSRILSFISLVIGEIGMSFIPVLAFFPKASFPQVILLAIIYFITSCIICFTSWGIHAVGVGGHFAFVWKDNQFYVNTYALFTANIFSLACLILSFKLVYDEEMANKTHQKKKSLRGEQGFSFSRFKPPLLKRPTMGNFSSPSFSQRSSPSPSFTSQPSSSPPKGSSTSNVTNEEFIFDQEIEKPFQFEPDIDFPGGNMPEESSGKLFSKDAEEKSDVGQFFEDEATEYQAKKTETRSSTKLNEPINPTTTKIPSPFPPPSDIKNDLAAIFEQYSSLNAVKKLTGAKTNKSSYRKKEGKSRRPYIISKESPDISVEIEQGEVHEASFRQISGQETVKEIKEDLKEEINQEILSKLDEKTHQINESLEKTENIKEDIINSIKNIKEELLESLKEEIKTKFEEKPEAKKIEAIHEEVKKEIHDELLAKFNEKSAQIEESLGKTEMVKQEFIQSMKSIKEELIDSLKQEFKSKTDPIEPKEKISAVEKKEALKIPTEIPEEDEFIPDEEKFTPEELKKLEDILIDINKEPNVAGSMFISQDGKVLREKWEEGKKLDLPEKASLSFTDYFNTLNKEINKTNQSGLYNILLESENGILFLTRIENKILTVYTEGKGEIFSGKILRSISKIEEKL